MAAMSCREFVERSGEWMDGERHPAASSHWAACANCRSLIGDLEAIRQSAAALPELDPPAYLWNSIKARIEAETRVSPKPSARWLEGFARWRAWRPALAGAYLALIIGLAISLTWHPATVRQSQDQISQNLFSPSAVSLTANLVPAAPKTVAANESDVTATLNRNLAIVDSMISMCEKNARENPQDEMARDYLYSAYQQKADLLAVMADNGGNGR